MKTLGQMMGCAILCAMIGACDAPRNEAGTPSAVSGLGQTDDQRPRPGRYQATLTDEFFGDGNAPEHDSEEVTDSFTATDFIGDSWVTSFLTFDNCRDATITIADGDIGGRVLCDFPEVEIVAQPMELRGSYTPEGWDIVVDATLEGRTWRQSGRFQRIAD